MAGRRRVKRLPYALDNYHTSTIGSFSKCIFIVGGTWERSQTLKDCQPTLLVDELERYLVLLSVTHGEDIMKIVRSKTYRYLQSLKTKTNKNIIINLTLGK